jgi:hypothetical protein
VAVRLVEVDLALVERGLKGHEDTVRLLVSELQAIGLRPRLPVGGEPNYDLAWEYGGSIYLAEVKSITDVNEEGQLRLGLGQLLRFHWLLSAMVNRPGRGGSHP